MCYDELIYKCLDEIALNGKRGMTTDELWGHLKGFQFGNQIITDLNINMKMFIHRSILEHELIEIGTIIIPELPKPLTPKKNALKAKPTPSKSKSASTPQKKLEDKVMEDKDNEKEGIATDNNLKTVSVINDSMDIDNKTTPTTTTTSTPTTTTTTTTTTTQLTSTNTQFELFEFKNNTKTTTSQWAKKENEKAKVVQEKLKKIDYQDRLDGFAYFAQKELILESYGINADMAPTLSEIQWTLLDSIAYGRKFGLIQKEASDRLSIDPRNIFFPIKGLSTKGVIMKMDVYNKLSNSSRVLLLKRFFAKSIAPSDLVLQGEWRFSFYPKVVLVSYMNGLPNRQATIGQIKQHVLKDISETTLKKFKKTLVDDGIIEQINSEKRKNDGSTILRLVKPMKEFWDYIWADSSHQEDDDSAGGASANAGGQEESENTTNASNLVIEQGVLEQIYQIIREAGPNGTTQKELTAKVGGDSPRFIASVVRTFIASYRVKVIPETVGKQLTYRIFCDPSDQIIPNPTNEEKVLLLEFHDKLQKETDPKNVNSIHLTPFKINNSTGNQPIILAERNTSSLVKQLPKEERADGQVKNKIITAKHRARMDYIMEFIGKAKGTADQILFSACANHDQQLDRKTFNRLLESLLKENKIKMVKIYTYNFSQGHKTYPFVFDSKYEFEDEDIQTLVEATKDVRSISLNTGVNEINSPQMALTVAKNYGFVKGIYIRAKILHILLFKYTNNLIKAKNETTIPPNTTFFVTLFLRSVPINECFQMISQTVEIPDIKQYLDSHTIIDQLPESLKQYVFKSKFMSKVTTLLDVLKKFGLIDIEENQGLTQIIFKSTITLKFTSGSRKDYLFQSIENVRSFWSDLQFQSLLPNDEDSISLSSDLPNIHFLSYWGIPRQNLSSEVKSSLLIKFKEKTEIMKKNDIIELAKTFNIGSYKCLLMYKRYLYSQNIEFGDKDLTLSRKQPSDQTLKVISKGNSILSKRNASLQETEKFRAKRTQLRNEIKPYSRLRWQQEDDSLLLHHYNNTFRSFFDNYPKNHGRINPNSPFYITPSGIPGVLNEGWKAISDILKKPAGVCYSRMKLLVKKYPSYQQFAQKKQDTFELPENIDDFERFFSINRHKSLYGQHLQYSLFSTAKLSIMRDKILLLLRVPESVYTIEFGIEYLGTERNYDSSTAIHGLYDDGVILQTTKTQRSKRAFKFPSFNKLILKSDYFNIDFFQENRIFLEMVKGFPLDKFNDDQLFEYDPLTSGGSVSQMIQLMDQELVDPILSLKPTFVYETKTDKPKTRDRNYKRVDSTLDKLNLAYFFKNVIDHNYFDNYESHKKRLRVDDDMDEDDQDDEEEEIDNENNTKNNMNVNKKPKETVIPKIVELTITDDSEYVDMNQKEKEIEIEKRQQYKKILYLNEDDGDDQVKEKIKEDVKMEIDELENYTELNFVMVEVKETLLNKLKYFSNGQSIEYLCIKFKIIEEIILAIKSSGTTGMSRNQIIQHLLDNFMDKLDILKKNDLNGIDGDMNQYLYQEFPKYLLEIKSFHYIDVVFTYYQKIYIHKSFYIKELLPLDASIDYKFKTLPKPWISYKGQISHTKFSQIIIKMANTLIINPGMTLEHLTFIFKEYPASLLREFVFILRNLDLLDVESFHYQPPTLYTKSEYSTFPVDLTDDTNVNLVITAKPSLVNLPNDFSLYLLSLDF